MKCIIVFNCSSESHSFISVAYKRFLLFSTGYYLGRRLCYCLRRDFQRLVVVAWRAAVLELHVEKLWP